MSDTNKEREAFEKDAAPYGFDLTRISLPSSEPWCEYESHLTGHRWGGWLAARALSATSGCVSDERILEAFVENEAHSEQGDNEGWMKVSGEGAVRIGRAVLALAPGLSGWQEIASGQNEKMTAREGLNRFLDEAASEGYVFANIDAADLYVALFPDEYERAAAIKAPGIAPHQPPPEGDDMEPIKEGWQVSFCPTGHSGSGVYAHMDEYPDEGAVLLFPMPPGYDHAEPVTAQPQPEPTTMEANLLRVECAGLESSVGHLSSLVDHLRDLLGKAIDAMSALHGSAAPDESTPDLDARIPANAYAAFVNAHAELLYARANGPAANPEPQPEPTSKGDGGAHYVERCGRCAISGPRDDVLHLSAIIHSSQQRETQEAGKAETYTEFLKREFGEGMGQDRVSFSIGNVSRAFGAGLEAGRSRPPEPTRDEDDQYTLDRAADFLEHYAAFLNRVKPDEIEEHPYRPEIEMVAADLRKFAPSKEAGKVEAVADEREAKTIGEAMERSGLIYFIKDGDLAHSNAAVQFAHLMAISQPKETTEPVADAWMLPSGERAITAKEKARLIAEDEADPGSDEKGYRKHIAERHSVPLYLRPSQQALGELVNKIKRTALDTPIEEVASGLRAIVCDCIRIEAILAAAGGSEK